MSKYNIKANSIGTVGDTTIHNYGVSQSDLREIRLFVDELRRLQASPLLQPVEKQELQGALNDFETAFAAPDKLAAKTALGKLSPGLRTLLSSIGANLTSDVLVASFTHAVQHLDSIRALLGL